MKKNIGILMGGFSSEYEISIKSAEVVYQTLKSDFNCHKILVERKNWYLIDKMHNKLKINQSNFNVELMPELNFDCMFNAIHGSPGEDGKIQDYFNKLKIPVTGSGARESKLTFDKIECNKFLNLNGVKVPNSVSVSSKKEYKIDEIIRLINLPCFVKASKSGSSYGVFKAYNKNELELCITKSLEFDEKVLIEEFIDGNEFSVGVITYNGDVIVLPITEIKTENDFFDFEAKYKGQSDEITPADISVKLKKNLREISMKIYKLLHLRGYSRSEFIVNKDGIFFLEVNTVPGLSKLSILPQQAKHAKISLKNLFVNSIYESINKI